VIDEEKVKGENDEDSIICEFVFAMVLSRSVTKFS
jgi:hypothetical protein